MKTNLVNYFIPERYLLDKELNRKSRFIIWFVYVVVFISIPIFILTFNERPDDVGNIIVGTLIPPFLFFSLWIFKRTGSFILITHLTCGFFTLAVSGAPMVTGGIYSPDTVAMYVIPIFALIMGNSRIGIFYAIAMMTIFTLYFIADKNGIMPYQEMTETLTPEYYLMNLVFNAVLILFMVFRNENLRLQLVGELKDFNKVISEKNKEITDSINYARRIQSAILPQQQIIEKLFPNSFFLYKPKDIVSGDFYWVGEKDNSVFLAVADCTGHGVPGAFMSVIGVNLLNEIINEKGITNPTIVLSELNKSIMKVLQQNQTETNDGMDISLVRINSASNQVEFAGANRPLYLLKNGELTEHKSSKFPIGGFNSGKDKNFETTKLELEKGDTFYLTSDGFADQFGGLKNKKITTKNFKKMLETFATKNLNDQQNQLEEFFNDWKKGYEQTDDVLVVGVRV